MNASRVVLALAVLGMTGAADAQVIAYDHFSGYSSAELINQTGQGYGWTGNWVRSGNSLVGSAQPTSDLTYSGLTGETGRVYFDYTSNATIYRSLPTVSSGTVYFGAVVQFWSVANAIRRIQLTGEGAVYLGEMTSGGGETTTIWLDVGPKTGGLYGVNTGITITTEPTYLVGKIEFNTSGSLDSIRLWVNPTSVSDLENNANATASILNTYDVGTLNTFGWYQNTWNPGSPGGYMDEVRISSLSSDMLGSISAVPEPSTYAALAGVAALGLAAARRRVGRRNRA